MLLATPRHLFAAFGPEEVLALCGSFPASRFTRDQKLPASEAELSDELRAVLTDALGKASSEAAGYLALRYPLFGGSELPPDCLIPPALIAAVCDMARYRLVGAGVQQTDPIVTRYTQALAWLRDLAEGRAVLAGMAGFATRAGGVSVSPGTRDWVRPIADDPVSGSEGIR